ncbi:hypothetical protein ACWDYJ_27925 [Streptomyces sp. NPDC003042]
MRYGSGSWEGFGELTGHLGTVTAKSVAAATVNGELQVAVTTADDRVLHTIRHADRTWTATTPVELQGVPGTRGSTAMAGTRRATSLSSGRGARGPATPSLAASVYRT